MRQRQRAKGNFYGRLRLLCHRLQVAAALSYLLFSLLLILYRDTLRLDTHPRAKEVTQQRDEEEKTDKKLLHKNQNLLFVEHRNLGAKAVV